jgi:hypothetical protein
MNKNDLSTQTKLNVEKIDEILKAALLPLDLEDYTPEQVSVVQELINLVESKQAKTYKEASEIYRKPIREIQLEEIAYRHTIAHDRIPEILAGMKLKPETLTDEDLTHFESVCQQLQNGIDFHMAVQAAAPPKQGKGKKAQTMPELLVQPEGAIAVASPAALAEIPEELQGVVEGAGGNMSSLVLDSLKDRSLQAVNETIETGLSVLPQAFANKVQQDMLAAVQSKEFTDDICARVKKMLDEKYPRKSVS